MSEGSEQVPFCYVYMCLLKVETRSSHRSKSPVDQSPGFQLPVHEKEKETIKEDKISLLKSSLLTFILSFPFLILTSQASPTDYASHDNQQKSLPILPLRVEIIHEFPGGTWIENLAIRSNGLILANLLSAPEIYQVDPSTHAAVLAAKIPAATGLLGIAEIERRYTMS